MTSSVAYAKVAGQEVDDDPGEEKHQQQQQEQQRQQQAGRVSGSCMARACALLLLLLLLLLLCTAIVASFIAIHRQLTRAPLASLSNRQLACPVEDSAGFWDISGNPYWFISLPGECVIYPFVAELLRLPTPPQMPPWPVVGQPTTAGAWLPSPAHRVTPTQPAAAAAAVTVAAAASSDLSPWLHFLQDRYVLWLSDSIDRMPIEYFCTINNSSFLVPPANYVSVHPFFNSTHSFYPYDDNVWAGGRQGVRVCQLSTLRLLLVHVQLFGVFSVGWASRILQQSMPIYLGRAANRTGWSRVLGTPDVVVVHSCAWDWDTAVMQDHKTDWAVSMWSRAFEVEQLIPALTLHSANYRRWQELFVQQAASVEANSTAPRDVNVIHTHYFGEHKENKLNMYELAPTPVTHPLPLPRSVPQQAEARVTEPMFVLRTCPPMRGDAEGLLPRRQAILRVNRGIRMLAGRYGVRVLDVATMFDGLHDRPEGVMRDAVHYLPNPTYQSLNVLFNMYRQHQLLLGQADTER